MKRHKSFNTDPLIEISRGNILENIHSGWICVLNKDKKIIYEKGNLSDYAFLRSIAKPIQAIQTLNSKIKTTPKELAIICGSHTGSLKHLDILKDFIKKNNLNIKDLKCGMHQPSDETERTFPERTFPGGAFTLFLETIEVFLSLLLPLPLFPLHSLSSLFLPS